MHKRSRFFSNINLYKWTLWSSSYNYPQIYIKAKSYFSRKRGSSIYLYRFLTSLIFLFSISLFYKLYRVLLRFLDSRLRVKYEWYYTQIYSCISASSSRKQESSKSKAEYSFLLTQEIPIVRCFFDELKNYCNLRYLWVIVRDKLEGNEQGSRV